MTTPPVILFGAFDRHNFGDLLFPGIVGALLPAGARHCFGLAKRDLRPVGGQRVGAIGEAPAHPGAVIHAGGELFSCSAWEAAVMLSEGDEARDVVARLDGDPAAAAAWAAGRLGTADRAPYVLGEARFGPAVPRIFNAVGGADLANRDPALVAEVVEKLRTAAHVGVRDRATRACLAQHGIATALAPDPAVLVAECFGPALRRRAARGPVAALRRAFPGGYLALQCSADFGDDATLDTLACQLRQLPADLGVVLFRAGAAPWHDDLAVYRRLAARLAVHQTRMFTGLHREDIGALLAHARAFAGSSLHGRIVATAFGVPAVSLVRSGAPAGKVAAYIDTWEDGKAVLVTPDILAPALDAALATDPASRRTLATDLAATYRRYFLSWRVLLA